MSHFTNLTALTNNHATALATWVFENKLSVFTSGEILEVQVVFESPVTLPKFCKAAVRNTFHRDIRNSAMAQYYKVCHGKTSNELRVIEYQLLVTPKTMKDFKLALDKLKNPEKYIVEESEWI